MTRVCNLHSMDAFGEVGHLWLLFRSLDLLFRDTWMPGPFLVSRVLLVFLDGGCSDGLWVSLGFGLEFHFAFAWFRWPAGQFDRAGPFICQWHWGVFCGRTFGRGSSYACEVWSLNVGSCVTLWLSSLKAVAGQCAIGCWILLLMSTLVWVITWAVSLPAG